MVFTVFDRDALIKGLEEHIKNNKFYRSGKDISTEIMTMDMWDSQMTNVANQGATMTNGANLESAIARTQALSQEATVKYADEVPPFDITISFVNEYGQKAVTILYGVEILNEGQGFSTDSLQAEKACTFVARKVEYMRAVV